jgi:hypothetical protein
MFVWNISLKYVAELRREENTFIWTKVAACTASDRRISSDLYVLANMNLHTLQTDGFRKGAKIYWLQNKYLFINSAFTSVSNIIFY